MIVSGVLIDRGTVYILRSCQVTLAKSTSAWSCGSCYLSIVFCRRLFLRRLSKGLLDYFVFLDYFA